MPTLIFDEVDVGIGGRVAEIVGRMLERAGRSAPGAVRHPPAAGGGTGRLAVVGGQAEQRSRGAEPRAAARCRRPRRGDRPHAGRRRGSPRPLASTRRKCWAA
ncbi:MAG: hypothetical protein MZW92_79385 [Comamonadaceae bacterium]|nr:hypothetical protein [Comamonadaceae bacterium]